MFNKNQILNDPLPFILSVITFFIILFIIYIFIRLIHSTIKEKKELKTYEITLPRSGDGKNFLFCPKGCDRSVCKEKNTKEGHCQYDFQCQYCEDRHTHQFYVGGNYENERKIIPTLEQPKIKDDDFEQLNKDIKENNQYVKELNKEIKRENDLSMAMQQRIFQQH